MNTLSSSPTSHMPHRLAVALVCVTFPLIWVGGLVTTYDAGMAVPDWPTTYGYNLLLYPWQTWLWGPWDLFIEHGHRLLGALAGLVTIGLLAAVWLYDDRRWMRWLAIGAFVGVVGQGVLGGMRVRFDEVLLARIHGCTGPAFFAYAVALSVFTSRTWRSAEAVSAPRAGQLQRLALATTALAYLQLVLGSALRHMPVWAAPGDFRAALVFHLLLAAGLTVHVVLLWIRAERTARDRQPIVRPARVLLGLIGLQLVLGLGTWMVKYGWPTWLGYSEALADRVGVVHAESLLQAQVTTAHVALGSLILVVALVVALRSLRLLRGDSARAATRTPAAMELAL